MLELQNSAGTKSVSFNVKIEEAPEEPEFVMKLHDTTTTEGGSNYGSHWSHP